MKLAEIQTALFALTSGEVEPSVEAVGFVADSGVDPRRRVAVYAEGIRGKSAHAVSVPFGRVLGYLGEERFVDLFDALNRSRPPERRGLRELMSALPGFLAGDERWGRPDLGALAELDLARHEVSREVGVEPVGPAALAAVEAARWPAARLTLIPALRLVRLSFDVSGLWKSLDAHLPPPPPVLEATRYAVWRKGLDVYHSALSAAEVEALDRAAAGAPLSEVLAVFDDADAAHSALHGWFTDGLVGSVNAS
ncbi:MAG TPA: hypothetical protein VGN09_12290 [Vicinamibacteria bacterium]|jgi:hypothetical protein